MCSLLPVGFRPENYFRFCNVCKMFFLAYIIFFCEYCVLNFVNSKIDMISSISSRVEALRKYMSDKGLAAFVVVSSDAHSSEYVAEHWKSREWISGFNGSAGTVVVTKNDALLWTDSRYWLAVEKIACDTGYTLMRDGAEGVPSIAQWLCKNIAPGDTVALEGAVCSIAEVDVWRDALSACGIKLDASHSPFDAIWEGRPPVPMGKAEVLPLDVVGESCANKISRLRDILRNEGATAMIVTMLDEVAWLTNMRGNDVEYNPVLVAYMIVKEDDAMLFVEPEKLTPAALEHLGNEGISTAPYGALWSALSTLEGVVLLQPNRCNSAVLQNIKNATVLFKDSPVAAMKAVKNNVEIDGFKKAMLSEGVAMVKLLYWLNGIEDKSGLSEMDIDEKLTELRSADKNFRGLSFATISAYGENGAIVHYEPTKEEHSMLGNEAFLLLDCGGQYTTGTTDITRTISLGTLSGEQCEDYTRVLKGHISLSLSKFPKGTCGTQLDVLARQWLWQASMNYLHGTGHGVGHFLNVHEGPHQIRMNNMPAPLLPGVTVTNEPGLYKAGRHGIRIENTMLVVPAGSSEFGDFCAMEALTLCPIDKRPIVADLLGRDEIEYLNKYHGKVYEALSPYLEGEELHFLEEACAAI